MSNAPLTDDSSGAGAIIGGLIGCLVNAWIAQKIGWFEYNGERGWSIAVLFATSVYGFASYLMIGLILSMVVNIGLVEVPATGDNTIDTRIPLLLGQDIAAISMVLSALFVSGWVPKRKLSLTSKPSNAIDVQATQADSNEFTEEISNIESAIQERNFDEVIRMLEDLETKQTNTQQQGLKENLHADLDSLQSELVTAGTDYFVEALQDEQEAGDIECAKQTLDEFKEFVQRVEDLCDTRASDAREKINAFESQLDSESGTSPDKRLIGMIGSMGSAQSRAQKLLDQGDREQALKQIESALDTCTEAQEINRRNSLERGDRLRDLRTELESIHEEAQTKITLIESGEEYITKAKREIQASEYEAAQETVSELQDTVEGLREVDGLESYVSKYSHELSRLDSELEKHKAEARAIGFIGSAGSARSKAESLIDEGASEQAERRLESALESLDEAAELNSRHDLGKDQSIRENRDEVQELLEDLSTDHVAEVRTLTKIAEETVEAGIEAREKNKYDSAIQSFEDALETYERALEVVTENGLEEEWEITQRHSMVSDYLTQTAHEREEHLRSTRENVVSELDAANAALRRAEQHEEVEDHVAAKESLDEGMQHLDDAAAAFENDLVDDSVHERYEELRARSKTIKDILPDNTNDEGEDTYRNRDLLESLQELGSKIGESPTPEFVNACGEYPADAYLDAFGSWPETLTAANLNPIDKESRERRHYSRVEILTAIYELSEALGRPPTKTEMNEKGEISSTTVENRFVDWGTAIRLAGMDKIASHEAATSSSQPTSGARENNESEEGILAEMQNEMNELHEEESD